MYRQILSPSRFVQDSVYLFSDKGWGYLGFSSVAVGCSLIIACSALWMLSSLQSTLDTLAVQSGVTLGNVDAGTHPKLKLYIRFYNAFVYSAFALFGVIGLLLLVKSVPVPSEPTKPNPSTDPLNTWYAEYDFWGEAFTHILSLGALVFVMHFFSPDGVGVQEYAYYATIDKAGTKIDAEQREVNGNDLEIGGDDDENEFNFSGSKNAGENDVIELLTKVKVGRAAEEGVE